MSLVGRIRPDPCAPALAKALLGLPVMQLFNRIMALVGFTCLASSMVAFALAGELQTGAFRWVLDLATAIGPTPPLSF